MGAARVAAFGQREAAPGRPGRRPPTRRPLCRRPRARRRRRARGPQAVPCARRLAVGPGRGGVRPRRPGAGARARAGPGRGLQGCGAGAAAAQEALRPQEHDLQDEATQPLQAARLPSSSRCCRRARGCRQRRRRGGHCATASPHAGRCCRKGRPGSRLSLTRGANLRRLAQVPRLCGLEGRRPFLLLHSGAGKGWPQRRQSCRRPSVKRHRPKQSFGICCSRATDLSGGAPCIFRARVWPHTGGGLR